MWRNRRFEGAFPAQKARLLRQGLSFLHFASVIARDTVAARVAFVLDHIGAGR
ncbi:MAG: hypothetical protein ACTHKR_00540 [Sphingomonas sp.]